jgi:hypothetical protein
MGEGLRANLTVLKLVALWLLGATMLLVIASKLNLPHVNEHGDGVGIAIALWLCGLIAALIHSRVILRRRRMEEE